MRKFVFVMGILVGVAAAAAACGGSDCREDCAIKCANFPTHDCLDACEDEDCADGTSE